MPRQAFINSSQDIQVPAPEDVTGGLRERSVYTYHDLLIDIIDAERTRGGPGAAEEFYRYRAPGGGSAAYRTLIVARIADGAQDKVAEAFAVSDAGALPELVGVVARSLYRCGGLYLHHIHGHRPIGPAVAAYRDHPDFVAINTTLDAYITPFDPRRWRSPADAMAVEIYHCSGDPAGPRGGSTT